MPAAMQSILEDLGFFQDRTQKIEALISIAEGYQHFSTEEVPRTAASKIPGCESEVFLGTQPEGAGFKFKFAVDNPQGISAMAMAQILDRGASGSPLREVLEIPDDLPYRVFGNELSMGKTMGLMGMLRMVKSTAAAALDKSQ